MNTQMNLALAWWQAAVAIAIVWRAHSGTSAVWLGKSAGPMRVPTAAGDPPGADMVAGWVRGCFMEDARRRQTLSRLVEFYTGSEWLLVDPRTGAVGLPADFLVWTRGRASVLDVIGVQNPVCSFR